MEIKTYLAIIVRRWWLILLVTLAVGAASIYISPLIPPKYEAETSLRVITPLGGSLGDISYQTYYADRLMNTYAQIAASDQVMGDVKSKLGLKKLPDITVKTVPSSEIIDITVSGEDPELVAKTANALADIIIARSQASMTQDNTSSEELKILTNRQTTVQQELDQAKQEREKLVSAYADTTAQMSTLNRTIQMKESNYQNLLNEYQQAVVSEGVAIYLSTKTAAQTTKKIVGVEVTALEQEIALLHQQYQNLSANSVTYSQQISSVAQAIQSKESANENLLSQIDAARVADSKHESAQDVMIANRAVTPTKPTGPGATLIIGLGFLAGLMGGVLLAFLVNTLDTRLLTLDQVQRATRLPILGSLPSLSRKDRSAPMQSEDINVQRAFGNLCTKILALQQNRPVKTILVTSPNPEEGKSTIVMAIAEGLARANRKVLVVDTDLRKPTLPKLFHTSGDYGLSSLLRGKSKLEDVVQILPASGVNFLASGLQEDDPSLLFHTPAFNDLLGKFASYDIVLFDSPALLAVPDAYNLAMLVDGIFLVVQRKRTTFEDIKLVNSQLEDVKSKLFGTIVNRGPMKRAAAYYHRKSVIPAQTRVSSKPV